MSEETVRFKVMLRDGHCLLLTAAAAEFRETLGFYHGLLAQGPPATWKAYSAGTGYGFAWSDVIAVEKLS